MYFIPTLFKVLVCVWTFKHLALLEAKGKRKSQLTTSWLFDLIQQLSHKGMRQTAQCINNLLSRYHGSNGKYIHGLMGDILWKKEVKVQLHILLTASGQFQTYLTNSIWSIPNFSWTDGGSYEPLGSSSWQMCSPQLMQACKCLWIFPFLNRDQWSKEMLRYI